MGGCETVTRNQREQVKAEFLALLGTVTLVMAEGMKGLAGHIHAFPSLDQAQATETARDLRRAASGARAAADKVASFPEYSGVIRARKKLLTLVGAVAEGFEALADAFERKDLELLISSADGISLSIDQLTDIVEQNKPSEPEH